MSSALPKRLKDSLATRPEIQITHTRGGRQSLAPVDINTLGPDPHKQGPRSKVKSGRADNLKYFFSY